MRDITYPPEMLPTPEEGEEVEVYVEHPDTRKRRLVFSAGTIKLQLDCDAPPPADDPVE